MILIINFCIYFFFNRRMRYKYILSFKERRISKPLFLLECFGLWKSSFWHSFVSPANCPNFVRHPSRFLTITIQLFSSLLYSAILLLINVALMFKTCVFCSLFVYHILLFDYLPCYACYFWLVSYYENSL